MRRRLNRIDAFDPLLRLALICFADDDGGGDDGGGDDGGGDDGGGSKRSAAAIAAAAGNDGGGDDGGGGDGGDDGGAFDISQVPENLRGESAEETLAKLFPSWKGYRDKDASAAKPPEKVDDYPLPELSDEAKTYFPDLQNDSVYKIVQTASLKHGVTTDQFKGLFGEVMEELGKSGMLVPAVDPTEEYKKLGGDASAARLAKGVEDFIGRVSKIKPEQGGLPPELVDELDMLGGTAEGMQLIDWFMKRQGEQGVDLDGDAGPGEGWTAEKVREAMRDDRYQSDHPKYDRAFRKKVDEANRALSRQAA